MAPASSLRKGNLLQSLDLLGRCEKNVFMQDLMENILYGIFDGKYSYGNLMENIFMEGATERAIARTTATNIVAKPSSGETTRS